MEPLVSVIIPAYNAAATIQRALTSALGQDYQPLEVIAVDDGSSDSTADLVRHTSDPRLRLVVLPENVGAAAALNEGIRCANGKYVAFLDADDEWLPAKLALQVARMEQDERLTLVTCDSVVLSHTGAFRWRYYDHYTPVEGPEAWKTLLSTCYIPHPTTLVRRKDLEEVGGFDPSLRVGYDQDLWIRLAARGSVGVVPQVLLRIYGHQPQSLMVAHRDREADVLIPLLEKYIRLYRDRLSDREIRAIWGRRLFYFAVNLYGYGEYRRSISLFWKAATFGYRPLKALLNVPRAALMSIIHFRFQGSPQTASPRGTQP